MIVSGVVFLPKGTFGNVWGCLGTSELVGGGAAGIWWVKARDEGNCSTAYVHRQPSAAQTHLARDVSSVGAGKSCSRTSLLGKKENR